MGQPTGFSISLASRMSVWNAARTTIASAEDGTRGYVLTRAADKFGRPIAFIYPGEPPAPDGSMYHLEPDALRGSFNLHALSQGLAYATYYWGLFHDLRDELTTAVVAARAAGRGIYAEDVTTTGFEVAGMASPDRRFCHYAQALSSPLGVHSNSTGTAIGFKQALEASREPVLELPDANFTHFDTFVEAATGIVFAFV